MRELISHRLSFRSHCDAVPGPTRTLQDAGASWSNASATLSQDLSNAPRNGRDKGGQNAAG